MVIELTEEQQEKLYDQYGTSHELIEEPGDTWIIPAQIYVKVGKPDQIKAGKLEGEQAEVMVDLFEVILDGRVTPKDLSQALTITQHMNDLKTLIEKLKSIKEKL